MPSNDDSRLDDLFRSYRDSCPDPEPSVDFMPNLWRKIEARHSFWFVFQRLARTTMTACAALCLLLLVLNFMAAPETHLTPPPTTYIDALMEDHNVENTYYTEAIGATPATHEATVSVQH